jgi:EAL domain-containing protein (putative c-di-GMP-specific phosphodiesterase class I)
MSGMDGIQFARHLAERRFRGGVLLTSGVTLRLAETVGQLFRHHRLRFLGVFPKPLVPASLEHALTLLAAEERVRTARPPLDPLRADELQRGLERGTCVEAFFQPKVSMATRKVLGAECLARWRDPERGLLPPVAFIPVAEEHGLIEGITQQMYAHGVRQLGQWNAEGHPLGISINVSSDDLTRFDLPDEFAAIARDAGVGASQLTLELTESRIMRDASAALEILARFRLKGFGLSIDDFGTGYSNLGNLKLLPFSELKVDRAFVFGASRDMVAKAILESSVRLAEALDMSVVAEGAETNDDLQLLESVGCDIVQGYVVARPMPAQEFLAWKLRWERGT